MLDLLQPQDIAYPQYLHGKVFRDLVVFDGGVLAEHHPPERTRS